MIPYFIFNTYFNLEHFDKTQKKEKENKQYAIRF